MGSVENEGFNNIQDFPDFPIMYRCTSPAPSASSPGSMGVAGFLHEA
jgi:hypothetical protein